MSEKNGASATLILCDCTATQSIDADGLAQATGLKCSRVFNHLCGPKIEKAAEAIAAGNAVICCAQEAATFEEVAAELGVDAPGFVDIRDRAGWHAGDAPATAKMAALIADAALAAPPVKTMDVSSEGLCLILGPEDVALRAAERLKDVLGVTVLLESEDAPPTRDFDVIRGKLHRATGAIGGFELTFKEFQQVNPAGRGSFGFSAPRSQAESECDIILDLSGGTPLFPAPEKREGYLRADPKSERAVADAIFEAAQLIGTFEKPLYVRLETTLCAHSRAEQIACSNCIDNCPTAAITSAGEHVAIDPMICAGCGSCASLCPSGAITYDAPATDHLIRRIQTMAQTYLRAAEGAPRLLAVDPHGSEMIRLLARFGRGLPVDVVPIEVPALNTFGHTEALAALAAGFARVSILMGPGTERDALLREADLARAIAGGAVIEVLELTDPDALGEALLQDGTSPAPASTVRPMGSRRQITRQAARALRPDTKVIDLPDTAPYGAVVVNQDACTLCLSCVSLCPSGALGDNPDLPQLRFQEDACLQCGLCASVCPEDAITYVPRLNLTEDALRQVVLYEEEPFACISCGTLFGSRSTVERITEKLAQHPMYQGGAALDLIKMCDDCRIQAQYHSEKNPFAAGERPRPRTTEVYLSKRRDH
ncbi:4Fe-4S binding protein [Marimonas sp. MJW-29]|uniref:4Fe-4S binding protein n=1 Tax=Sulfitobacter sediminis TaxID=3234186 RepID=A0ABV3RKI8_9RHOB